MPTPESLKESAVNALIEYYLPEFYPLTQGAPKAKPKTSRRSAKKGKRQSKASLSPQPTIPSLPTGATDSYNTIRGQILANLEFIKSDQGAADLDSASPIAPKYYFMTSPGTINFKRIRQGLREYNPQVQEAANATTATIQAAVSGDPCLLPGQTPGVPSYSSGFPSYTEARQYFIEQYYQSDQRNPGGEIIINLGTAAQMTRDLTATLNAYNKQIIRYPAPLKIPLDLEAISTEIRMFVGDLVAAVRRDLNLSGKNSGTLGDDDVLRIQLGPNQNILSATYELDTLDGLEMGALKIGLFSLIKYNRTAKDPWLIETLRNHRRIISDFDVNARGTTGLSSLLEFIQSTYGPLLGLTPAALMTAAAPVRLSSDDGASIEVEFQAPAPPGVNPFLYNSIFQAAESSTKLDVSNPVALAATLSTFLRSEEVAALEVALNDPDAQAALFLENANKTFEAKFPIKQVIDDVIAMVKEAKGISAAVEERRELESKVETAEQDLQAAMDSGDGLRIEDAQRVLDRARADLTRDRTSSREGGGVKQVRDTLEIMDEVLARFGIIELIGEALICLTMGTNFSLDRIKDAINSGLDIAQMIEDYEPPKIPKPLLEIPEFPEIVIPNPITGDPPLWKQIVDMLLEILMELAMDLVSGLAEIIKFNCDNLLNRPEQLGAVDAAQAMKDNLKGGPPITPDMEDLLNNAFDQFGLDQDRGFDYLSAVSAVLTPLEVCRLFNSRADVQDTTIQKIAIFNTTWPEPQIQVLQSRNLVLSFFGALAPLANMETVCNDLINDVDLRAAIENYCLNEADLSPLADQESIQKLASMLNDGIPIDPSSLLPNLLCPEHPQFLANPVIDRVIPSIFNSTVDNVKMQFVYSVEASRATLLEPKVVAGAGGANGGGGNPAVDEALKQLCVHGKVGDDCVDPPKMDTRFLSTLSDIFEEISNVGLNIDPEVCPDVNLNKLGGSLEAFEEMLPIINGIIEDVLAQGGEAQAAIADVNNKIADIKATMDDGGGSPPNVTYVFSRNFYNNFMAMARQTPPEYVEIAGSDKPNNVWRTRTESPGGDQTYYSRMLTDKTNDEYGRLRMQYRFLSKVVPKIDPLNLEFYSNNDIMAGRPPFRMGIPNGLLPGVEQGWLEGIVDDPSFTPLYGAGADPEDAVSGFGTESDFNPYIFNFTYPLQKQLISLADAPLSAANKKYLQNKLQKQVFPTAMNGMVKRIFGYIQRNGIFTLAKLNSLNLFKDNTNCDPAQTGDLLDVRGILAQLKEDFGEAACNDEGDAKDCARDALKMGLINLFIQVYIVEFLIKNIFVVSAFQFEEIFEKPLLRELFMTSMVNQISAKLGEGGAGLDVFLRDRFEKMLNRTRAMAAGGITHSFARDTVVPYLKTGTDMNSLPFSKIIQYLIEERMGFTYEVCGQMVNTMQSINNILSTTGADSSYEDIFIKEVLGIYKAPYGRKNAPMKSGEGRVFFAKYAYWDGISNWEDLSSSEVQVPWHPRELERAQGAWDTSWENAVQDWFAAGGIHVTGHTTHVDWHQATVGARPDGSLPRHVLTLQDILGSSAGGAMPVRTNTAVDFIDLIELTEGTLPIFENLKVGYKLMFNFPHYRGGSSTAENDWDQSNSPFVQSFRSGPVRNLMVKAMNLQGRAVGHDSILDAAQTDLDASNPGAQILGDLLTVDIYAIGDFNPNELEANAASSNSNQALPSASMVTGLATNPNPNNANTGTSMDSRLDKIKRFNRTSPAVHVPRIKEDVEYSRFISQTFNPEMILMVPLLYNLGLTNTFFEGIEDNFNTTKQVILDLFGMMSRTDMAPPVGGPEDSASTALTNSLGSAGESDMGMSAREFIMKMLRETPIKILKGLAEMIDPHVAIWKIVREITGQVFSFVIDAIDQGIDVAVAVQPDESPIKPMLKDLEGEQLLALAFCGLNTMNAEATNALPDPPGPLEAPSLGPKMTTRGVDFTGTIVGLFCMPPSPLGIIYLLLMLLEEGQNNDEVDAESGTGNSQQNAADGQSSNVC